jgi:hypothetical protein
VRWRGTAALAKARRLGIAEDRDRGGDAASARPRDTARLLGREVALMHEADGVILADAGGGKPAPAAPVAAYVAKAFSDRLAQVRSAMEELAGRFERGELHRVGFRRAPRAKLDLPEIRDARQ